ncbi:hypothetical protein [Methylobacterium brachiatum]|uniref:hypothetical protein n=1 Tax=Methylobacterium brachiatum TaxID=269660 RepID=UPI00244B9451|nr:hypothetical protein [Methylobacterium brachiatum]MDH2308844.1 hypothetical protein [Methylobacterium brachiatum]
MASRVPDKTTDGPDGEMPGEGGPPPSPGRRPEADTAEKSEAEKAETERAAGDVADDLADFA